MGMQNPDSVLTIFLNIHSLSSFSDIAHLHHPRLLMNRVTLHGVLLHHAVSCQGVQGLLGDVPDPHTNVQGRHVNAPGLLTDGLNLLEQSILHLRKSL